MKKYVLLGGAIGIGGWQLYCDARISYVTETGCKPYMIYASSKSQSDTVSLKSFKECSIVNIQELERPPFVFCKRQIKRIVNQVMDFLNIEDGDDVCFESTNIIFALWAELFAKEANADHISYLLHSHIEEIPTETQKFFWHKYQQGKLGGMNDETLRMLFKNYKDIRPEDACGIAASWRSPLCESNDYDKVIDEIKACDYVIGYFGTLNKPHFLKLCDCLDNYFSGHNEHSFAFISIGSSANGMAEKKQTDVSNSHTNCKTVNIPALYPVPKNLFRAMDVCFGSWGSATVAARVGTYTVRLMDDVNLIPQGIIGVTLRSYPYKECDVGKESVEELLDNILLTRHMKLFPTFIPLNWRIFTPIREQKIACLDLS